MNTVTYKKRSYEENSYEAYGIFFETLANQNRLHIINALRAGEKNVSEVIATTGLEQTCVSHCLARLERCGFVSKRRQGKFQVYALNTETIEPLMLLIDKHTRAYCCHLIDAAQKDTGKKPVKKTAPVKRKNSQKLNQRMIRKNTSATSIARK